MRYASIRSMDISNGEGIGVALFVQGCHFRCNNCFNPETWDFNGGQEYTPQIHKKFMELIDRPYIKRVSILGGEPLCDENALDILTVVTDIKENFPSKKIWIYSGYTYDEIYSLHNNSVGDVYRREIMRYIDVLVDGRFLDFQKDISIKWKGSRNQNVIDMFETRRLGKMVFYSEQP